MDSYGISNCPARSGRWRLCQHSKLSARAAHPNSRRRVVAQSMHWDVHFFYCYNILASIWQNTTIHRYICFRHLGKGTSHAGHQWGNPTSRIRSFGLAVIRARTGSVAVGSHAGGCVRHMPHGMARDNRISRWLLGARSIVAQRII